MGQGEREAHLRCGEQEGRLGRLKPEITVRSRRIVSRCESRRRRRRRRGSRLGCLCLRGERKRWCCNELVAKRREVPSLISGNTAVSVAVEQERQRQDGRAGLEAASVSLSVAAGSCSAGISPSKKTFARFFLPSFFFLLLKNLLFPLISHQSS